MMTVGTITGLLDELKKSAVKEHTNTKMDNDKGFLDAPAINQELNDMLNNIIIELETLRMKEQISQEDFDSLVEFAEKYTNKIHV